MPTPTPSAHTDRPWVLVTGGATRVGRAFALAFAQAGWDVVCSYSRSREAALTTCEALRALGVMAEAVPGPLDRAEDVQALLPRAMAAMAGRLPQALVNNASEFEPDDGLQLDTDKLQAQLQVNLQAPLQLTSALAAAWAAAPSHAAVRPSAVHVLDQKVFNLNPDYFSYTVSKLALERAVALQAQALAPHLRVNGVAPGLMFVSGPQSPENFERARRMNLLGDPLDAMDVARTAVFLAQNPAITGCTLCVDNGQHLVPLGRDVMFHIDPATPPSPTRPCP